jgi:hypothetical protein
MKTDSLSKLKPSLQNLEAEASVSVVATASSFLSTACVECGGEIKERQTRVWISGETYCLDCGLADADPEDGYADALFNEAKESAYGHPAVGYGELYNPSGNVEGTERD